MIDDDGVCPEYIYFDEAFRKKPTAHLATRIFLDCYENDLDVPRHVMTFFIKEMYKQINKYEVDHPKWLQAACPVYPEQYFRFPKITEALANAEVNKKSEASIFKEFAGEETGYELNPKWELLRKRYKEYLKKKGVT